jgi:hypothetical protein
VPRLVLPARRSELPTAFKSLVKIGFPEWTVWDVPLAAHHAGAWRAERMLPNEPTLREPLSNRSDDVHRCLFADIYATRMAGPAYVCAMLLLRLDPAPPAAPDGDAATDHERAQVILKALTFAEPPDQFTGFVKGIGTDWHDAVKQNADGDATLYDAAALDEFADRVRAFLQSSSVSTYGATEWQLANERLAPLFTGQAGEPEQGRKILDLLNVAWMLRRAGRISPAKLQDGVMSLWSPGGGRPGHQQPKIPYNQSIRGE